MRAAANAPDSYATLFSADLHRGVKPSAGHDSSPGESLAILAFASACLIALLERACGARWRAPTCRPPPPPPPVLGSVSWAPLRPQARRQAAAAMACVKWTWRRHGFLRAVVALRQRLAGRSAALLRFVAASDPDTAAHRDEIR